MADKKFEPHIMYKGKKAENAETYQEHLKLKKMGFGHKKGPFKMKYSPLTKKVPNCVPKGKLKKEKGDPCWKNYVQRGMKTK
jgi:hypothetical protein